MMDITVKGLADYMTSNPAKQRKILKEFKYPALDEARAKIHYYREARDAVVAFHKGGRDRNWLIAQVAKLTGQSATATPSSQKRLRHNARALLAYATHFGDKKFEVLSKLNWKLTHSGVRISIQPDLHVRERDKEKVIKLEFSAHEPDERITKIIGQCMFEGARAADLNLPSSSVIFVDVSRGEVYKGARLGAYMRNDIHAACDTIADIWQKI